MSETAKAAATAAGGNQATDKPAQNQQPARRPNTRAVSDPREVAAVIMARMNVVNAKKDELTIAIKGMTDITQQLARAYAEQVQLIDHLAARVKALEATAGTTSGNGASPPAAAQGDHNA